jgi:hypothetical protein
VLSQREADAHSGSSTTGFDGDSRAEEARIARNIGRIGVLEI